MSGDLFSMSRSTHLATGEHIQINADKTGMIRIGYELIEYGNAYMYLMREMCLL